MELRIKAAKAMEWGGLYRILHQILSFVTLMVLVRVLEPEDFGLVGFAAIITNFAAMVTQNGLRLAIIHDNEITEENTSGIFWLNLILSFATAGTIVLISPLVAGFFEQPAVAPILSALSLSFPLDAIVMVHASRLEKELDFKRVTFINLTSILMGSILAISAALGGLGLWALVVNQLATSIFKSILLLVFVKWKPRKKFPFRKIKKHVVFSIYAQVSSLFNFFSRNIDDILIGKALGAVSLGLYQLSYRLMLWPLMKVVNVFGDVMFPVLSSISHDKVRVKKIYLRVISTVALISFPMVSGAFVIAPRLILNFFGQNWAGAIPIYQVLCLLGIMQAISTSQTWIFLSQGRSDLHLKVRIVASVIIVAACIIGIRYGVLGVAVGYAAACLYIIPYQLHVAGKLIAVSLLDIGRSIGPSLFCSLLMASAVFGLGMIFPPTWHYSIILACQVGTGVLLYYFMVKILRLKAYEETKELVTEQFKKKK